MRPGRLHKLSVLTMALVFALPLGGVVLPAQKGRTPAEIKAASQPQASHGVSFQIEVGLSEKSQVLMAVNAVTAFHCPEPVLQLLFGDKTGIGYKESIDRLNRRDFYLRPTQAGVVTDLFVEMASATVNLQLKTVKIPGGPKIGDYNGEVFVRLPGFKDEVVQDRDTIASLQRDLAACGSDRESAQQQAERERRQAVEGAQQDILDESMQIIANAGAKPTKPLDGKRSRVSQVGRPMRFTSGRWWVLLQVENRDKHKALIIEGIAAEGYGRVLYGIHDIQPHSKTLVGLAIEPPVVTGGGRSRFATQFEPTLIISFDGDSVTLPVTDR